jgi:DNA transposition AAA+ family ATPase
MEVVKLHDDAPDDNGDFVRTPTAQAILTTLGYCQAESVMGLIVGDPGMGKTLAAEHFVEEDPKHRVYVRCWPGIATAQSLLVHLVEKISGYAQPGASPRVHYADLLTVLERGWDPRILVLDEAEHLETAAVEVLRALHDEAEIAIVFLGLRELRDRWISTQAKRNGWAALVSRLDAELDLNDEAPGAAPEDVAAICDARGIQGRKERGLLTKASRGPGGLRNVAKLIHLAGGFAGESGITAANIDQAIAIRGGRG